jgi:hypothetical protein
MIWHFFQLILELGRPFQCRSPPTEEQLISKKQKIQLFDKLMHHKLIQEENKPSIIANIKSCFLGRLCFLFLFYLFIPATGIIFNFSVPYCSPSFSSKTLFPLP